jgi:predicted neutral ceramidase superfamily lipid hydrolase
MQLFNLVPSGQPPLPGDALRYGFAGAYWYILQMLVRRYFQNDLKTAAYISALTRIIIVTLLVAVVHVVWPSRIPRDSELALAFLLAFSLKSESRLHRV